MYLQLAKGRLELTHPVVMGVLNVTPDSFSDGGSYPTVDRALARAAEMVAEGAGILDVGGESTRPGAAAVSEQEELDRVIPVIEALVREFGCVVSVDTMKPAVMDAACAAGAALINDVNALESEGGLQVAVRHRAAVCLMHKKGVPQSMQDAPDYADVVHDVAQYLTDRRQQGIDHGIAADSILLDPGFGFGKTLSHNLRLFGALPRLAALPAPLLIGVSRKSMFGQLLGLPVEQRLHASVGAATLGAWLGAAIIRVHDVRPTVEALRFASAVRGAAQESS